MANSTPDTFRPRIGHLPSTPLPTIVEQLARTILIAGPDCTAEMARTIAKQYVRDHPEFNLGQLIGVLHFATLAHEHFQDRLQKLDWSVKMIDDGHPPFGWGLSLSGSDDIEFHVDFDIKGPRGEEYTLALTNGVWMNPFEIPGFIAPTPDE